MTYRDDSEWKLREPTSKKIYKELLTKYNSETALLLAQRGIDVHSSKRYLSPDISRIPDSSKLYNAKKAAKEIIKSINDGSKIYIHGDFDADGICATALLWDFLYREIPEIIGKKTDITPYIPDRSAEGYGLSESSLDKLVEKGAQLVVTVDCGIRDKQIIQQYQKNGLKFIVTDHHQPPDDLLENLNYTVVHQLYPEKEYPDRSVCGTFIAFLLIHAIKKELGIDSKISSDSFGLDLASIATITDMMPLIGANRDLLSVGLKAIGESRRVGLRKLIKVSGLSGNEIDTYHIGFVLGPRLNAAGRIGSPLDGARLLLVKNTDSAEKYANELDKLNKKRQKLTEISMQEASIQVDESAKLLFIKGDEWSEGIIGLVAGKLMEKYKRPVVVISRSEEGYRGSARSLGTFNITEALEKCNKYLTKYGGHAEAAGFSLTEENIELFREKLLKIADREIDLRRLIGSTLYDIEATTDQINMQFLGLLDQFKPFGEKNRKPTIMLRNCVVADKKVMGSGKSHMKIGVKSGVNTLPAVLFNCLEDIEQINVDDMIDLIGYPDINSWNGRSEVQFSIKKWRPSKKN